MVKISNHLISLSIRKICVQSKGRIGRRGRQEISGGQAGGFHEWGDVARQLEDLDAVVETSLEFERPFSDLVGPGSEFLENLFPDKSSVLTPDLFELGS